MLSEVTNFSPPEQIAAWLACAAFAIWFLLLVDKGIARMRGASPEPPNGELKQSIKQLNARMKVLEDWRAQLTGKMETDKLQILEAGSKRGKEIYEHIDDVRKELSEKLDGVQSRILADLANAKKL